jgi:exonuclease SbcC
MKVDQIYINGYGPLQKDLELDGEINVIKGPNESGKSLLVEAMLKHMADGSVSNPRITESPEGFVRLSDGGKNPKLGGDRSLSDYYEEEYSQEIRVEDLRNIFVIRNGDLSFNEDDDFYTHITDKLTGRRVEDIEEVEDELREKGRLMPSRMKVSSKSSFNDAGDQLDEAKELREEVADYIEEAEGAGLESAESELLAAKQEFKREDDRIDRLEAAKEEQQKRSRHSDLSKEKDTIKENLDELEELPEEEKLDDLEGRLAELAEGESEVGELQERKENNRSLAKWSLAGGVVSFVALIGLGLPVVGVIVPLVLFGVTGYLWRQANSLSGDITDINSMEEDILSDARAAGISAEDRESLPGEISSKQKQREDLETENKESRGVLKRELDIEVDDMEAVVEKAETELKDLKADFDDSVGPEFDEDELADAREAKGEARERIDELEGKLDEHQEELQEFHKRAHSLNFNAFTGSRLELEVENRDSLRQLHDRLDEFITAIEEDAETSKVAIEIFNEIQEEEKEETAELFEEGSRATELFETITDGRYTKVTYDNESNQLKVEKSTGEVFLPQELSDGTKDQLYLAIRVALGEQMLEGQPGFFIMDDAFLTSDSTRLSVQADMVDELAGDGWQIIYLSSKEDATEELESRSNSSMYELQPLE